MTSPSLKESSQSDLESFKSDSELSMEGWSSSGSTCSFSASPQLSPMSSPSFTEQEQQLDYSNIITPDEFSFLSKGEQIKPRKTILSYIKPALKQKNIFPATFSPNTLPNKNVTKAPTSRKTKTKSFYKKETYPTLAPPPRISSGISKQELRALRADARKIRNRESAERCRQKRLNHAKILEEQVAALKAVNERLNSRCRKLERDNQRLLAEQKCFQMDQEACTTSSQPLISSDIPAALPINYSQIKDKRKRVNDCNLATSVKKMKAKSNFEDEILDSLYSTDGIFDSLEEPETPSMLLDELNYDINMESFDDLFDLDLTDFGFAAGDSQSYPEQNIDSSLLF